jgi:Leucine-rich repeat (LRR) protein
LNLSGNLLSQIPNIAELFGNLGCDLVSIDLAENGFLDYPTEVFQNLMTKLPKGIAKIRLFEMTDAFSLTQRFKSNYHHLPQSIHCLEISSVGKKELELIRDGGLTYLPGHIDSIDLSNNQLFLYEPEELQQFFQKIPRNIKKIILANNFLFNISAHELRLFIQNLPAHIEEIALHGNGLDRLTHSRMNTWMSMLPDKIYDFSQDKLFLKHDGRVESYFLHQTDLYFKPALRLRKQSEWARFFPVISQILRQKQLSSRALFNVCEFLCESLTRIPQKQMPLYSIFDKALSMVVKKQTLPFQTILKLVTQRIKNHKEARLDLSYCGLNGLYSVNDYQSLYALIPNYIHTLNLRNNHLSGLAASSAAFLEGLKYLPPHIKFLDLSSNGFELEYSSLLREKFIRLPASVEYLALGKERPVSLSATLERRVFPEHFFKLTRELGSNEEKLMVLLNDYTQSNSRFKRMICGYWNRRHLPEVNRLMFWLAQGYLKNLEDIQHQLNLIKMPNEGGALAKIISFISIQNAMAEDKLRISLH